MSQGRDGALRWGGPQPHDTVKRRALQQGALTQALLLGRPRHSRWVDVTPTTYREDRRRAAAASWGSIESVYTDEGTHEVHTLVLGKAFTGINAF